MVDGAGEDLRPKRFNVLREADAFRGHAEVPRDNRHGSGEDFRIGRAALVREGDGGAFQLGDVGTGELLVVAEAFVLGTQNAGAELQVVLSRMNDSGFWTVSKLSGFTGKETLQSWTLIVSSISFTGLLLTMLLAWLLPMQ